MLWTLLRLLYCWRIDFRPIRSEKLTDSEQRIIVCPWVSTNPLDHYQAILTRPSLLASFIPARYFAAHPEVNSLSAESFSILLGCEVNLRENCNTTLPIRLCTMSSSLNFCIHHGHHSTILIVCFSLERRSFCIIKS